MTETPLPEAPIAMQAAAPKLISDLVERTAGLRWCHFKSNVRLPLSVAGGTDLDILVHPDDWKAFCANVRTLGFVAFDAPPWASYEGVSDWLGADADTGVLMHLHLHKRLITGMKGVKELELPWTSLMLGSRTLDAGTGIPIPLRAIEIHLLLAREVTKSNKLWRLWCRWTSTSPVDRFLHDEMAFLLNDCSAEDIEEWGDRLWGSEVWRRAAAHLDAHKWHRHDDFAAIAGILGPIMSPWQARPYLISVLIRLLARAHRNAALALSHVGLSRTQKKQMYLRAPMIAFIGSDGAGKSTVSGDLCKWLRWKADVRLVYFGSKDSLIRILQQRFGRSAKAARAGAGGDNAVRRENPTLIKALRVAYAAYLRLKNMKRAQRMMVRGRIVIADRFPQGEVRGTYDGPSDVDLAKLGWLARRLYLFEARVYERIAEMNPDLLIRLVVPLDVALARKPDHDLAGMARKVELTKSLCFEGIPSVEVNTEHPLEQVLVEVRRHAWQTISAAARGA